MSELPEAKTYLELRDEVARALHGKHYLGIGAVAMEQIDNMGGAYELYLWLQRRKNADNMNN
ncbi:hypothetical protein [Pseudarthrobacter sp. J47]|uniref:hypothetical protein n=1 Tax=Pseudarthrobacter sp. J47 TaxID=3116482 RepID=UPI002E804C08|nr:hypothetical protein [Pseudarthrobacter sp. J47]MEE2524664.1 hypothetical protein [Pseudarthrobacter sp. J47]